MPAFPRPFEELQVLHQVALVRNGGAAAVWLLWLSRHNSVAPAPPTEPQESIRVHSEEMLPQRLEEVVAGILAESRAALRVARARCYTMGPSGDFRLAGSYGFVSRFGPEDFLEASHPLVDWVQHHRRPAYANSAREAGRLAASMEREQYARMLAAPAYVGSRMVGIVELQDKLEGAFFAAEDLRAAEKLASRIAEVLESFNGTSVAAPEPLAPEDAEALYRPGSDGGSLQEFPSPPALFSSGPEWEDGPAEVASPAAAEVPAPSRPPVLSSRPVPREELVFRGFWSSLLLASDIDAVAFSSWTRDAVHIRIGARRALSEDARLALVESLAPVVASASPDLRPPHQKRFSTEFPLGRGDGEIQSFAGIQTSVIISGVRTLLVSLLFSRPPDEAGEEALKEVHRGIRAAVLQSASGERYRQSYRSLVKSLLEPGATPYPQLKAHSYAVGALCRRFATALRLPAEGIEQLTVAGLLHDIGIREVEVPYERLAGRRPLDLQEVALVRRHAVIGADILERIEFPYPIAPLVRHHHERYDGAGYPDGLSGDRIPFGSRVLAIAEAYDAMTALHSYRSPIAFEAALDILTAKGGTQFDPELARRFCELLRTTAPRSKGNDLPDSLR
ncbi:MAG: HD domain-containing phosphohydrolase [Thermoanaerobaculia bacterium]